MTKDDSNRTLSHTTFSYDTLCRLVETKNNGVTVTYEYDDTCRVIAEIINNRRTEYLYDAQQNYVTHRTIAGITERFSRGFFILNEANNSIEYAARQIENYCDKCCKYSNQVVSRPDFYYKTGNALKKGMFFTTTFFGSCSEKAPSIILGIETAKIIVDAVKTYKFRGADISKITVKVD